MQNRSTKKKPVAGKAAPNPTYVKIGKRIRQARLMAKESNSRQLSQRLGWSAGRINNFELGISTPGPEETGILCEALKANPAWVTYGVGSPRASNLDSTRYRNLMAVVEEADVEGVAPFTMFEFSRMGIVFLAAGLVYVLIFSRRLLPDRAEAATEKYSMRDFLTEPVQMATMALLHAYVGSNAEVVHDQVFQLNYVQI